MCFFEFVYIVNVLVCEFIYGDWLYEDSDLELILLEIIFCIVGCGGIVLIFVFVVGCV